MSRVLATLENFVFIVLLTSLSDMDSRAARAAKRDTARLQEELNAKRPKVDASGKCPDLEASPVKRFQHDSLVPSTHVHIFSVTYLLTQMILEMMSQTLSVSAWRPSKRTKRIWKNWD